MMWQMIPPEHEILVDGGIMDPNSFDDSEQFEEDSVCSWGSDSNEMYHWSIWKYPLPQGKSKNLQEENEVSSLLELCAKCVARNYPFEVVENFVRPIPENIQLRIAYWSFPDSEEEISLYSCLANGSNEKFKLGENLAKYGNVRDVLQIGFHLSGKVIQTVSRIKEIHNVSISFDRGKITSCQCSCLESAAWCEHTSALCLFRIYNRKDVTLRAPVSESLGRLERDQLQKFAQYLISELPQQILPTAQRLLDELLSSKQSSMNMVAGAPDPTAGASLNEEAKWVLDEICLKDNIKKVLARFFGPVPPVAMPALTSAPAVSLKWISFIHSLQRKDPEGMWNLLSIVRHMFSCGDKNASKLLHYITEECLICYHLMQHWVSSYASFQGNNCNNRNGNNPNTFQNTDTVTRYASAHFMEEIVHLWQLAVMDPYISVEEKEEIQKFLNVWNNKVLLSAKKGQGQVNTGNINSKISPDFKGFDEAIKASYIDWNRFYEMLKIPHDPKKDNSKQLRRASKLATLKDSTVFNMFTKISSNIPERMDELSLITILSQALSCHGFLKKSSKLASMLAQRILSTYPEKIRMGENNLRTLTQRSNSICEILNNTEYERSAFEVAMLGLAAPRLSSRSSLEEINISYLEMCLYEKLKGIVITKERLTLIRYQAKKLLTCPMLRGEDVLPLLLATFIFEVLCNEHVTSTVLQGPYLTWENESMITANDQLLGYNCAIKALGLISNAADHKQPMLCECLRHQRRDLALALLVHSRMNDSKVDNVLQVLLSKERYSFMTDRQDVGFQISQPSTSTHQITLTGNIQTETLKQNSTKKKKKKEKKQQAPTPLLPQAEAPSQPITEENVVRNISFANIRAAAGTPPSSNIPTNNARPVGLRLSSDSDSGNGDVHHKQSPNRIPHTARALQSTNSSVVGRKTQYQQRRQSRQNPTRGRSESKHSRNDRKYSKSSKSRKIKMSRELTESDSGQEMHFSFENDAAWSSVPVNQSNDYGSNDDIDYFDGSNVLYYNDQQIIDNKMNQSSVETSKKVIEKSIDSPSSEASIRNIESRDFPCAAEDSISYNERESLNMCEEDFSQSSSNLTNNIIPLLPPVQNNNDGDNDDAGYDEEFNMDDVMFMTKASDPSPSSDKSLSTNDHQQDAFQSPTDIGVSSESQSITSKEGSLDSLYNKSSEQSSSPVSDILDNINDIKCKGTLKLARDTLIATDSLNELNLDDSPERLSGHDMDKTKDNFPLSDSLTEIDDEKPENKNDIKIDTISDERKEKNLNGAIEQKDEECPIRDVSDIECSSDNPTINSHNTVTKAELADNTAKEENKTKELIDITVLKNSLESVSKIDDSTAVQQDFSNDSAPVEKQISSVSLPDLSSAVTNCAESITNDSVSRLTGSTAELNKTEQIQNNQKAKKNKSKKKKNKGRFAVNLQSIEAEAYSMFELAKSVLMQARNTASVRHTALFDSNINKKLQLSAFEIGLFALHIHNYSSPNWFSRTYSTYVSWIENLVTDIGSVALQILNDRWEGTLTPAETIQIATRASRSGDQTVKRNGAELVLSCLPYSQSLSSSDITTSIRLCREQDDELLERACSTVENVSNNGGIQPDLLFSIARQWHYLYEKRKINEDGGESNDEVENHQDITLSDAMMTQQNSNNNRQELQSIYITPEQFVQEQMHIQAQEILGRQIPRNTQQDQFTWMYPQYIGPLHHCPLPQQAIHSRHIPNIESYSVPYSNSTEDLNLLDIPRHLQNCYRVGMKAMEALTIPLPDERPKVKYAISPPCSEDMRWMCSLSASLGPTSLKNFCKLVYHAVTSPYLLHDLALEAARHFAAYNPAQLASHLRSPSVSPIVQKAMVMYRELINHDLAYLGSKDHSEFVDLLRRTRSAFCMAPGGMARFNEILEHIRKRYPKKRELWQLIMSGLSKA